MSPKYIRLMAGLRIAVVAFVIGSSVGVRPNLESAYVGDYFLGATSVRSVPTISRGGGEANYFNHDAIALWTANQDASFVDLRVLMCRLEHQKYVQDKCDINVLRYRPCGANGANDFQELLVHCTQDAIRCFQQQGVLPSVVSRDDLWQRPDPYTRPFADVVLDEAERLGFPDYELGRFALRAGICTMLCGRWWIENT